MSKKEEKDDKLEATDNVSADAIDENLQNVAYETVDEHEEKRQNAFFRFLKDFNLEVKKIIWPSKKELVRKTLIVIVNCCLFGAFIFAVDAVVGYAMNLIAAYLA